MHTTSNLHHHKGKIIFSTKQYIVMILAFPVRNTDIFYVDPTLRQIKESLKFYAGIDVTIRHIRSLLCELVNEGIIEREFHSLRGGPLGNQGQASSYKVVDFNKAFEKSLSLIESSKLVLARDMRRLKRREAKKRGSVLK